MDEKSDVVYFGNMANFIATYSLYESRNKKAVEDSKRIIVTAAKLIVNEFCSITFKSEFYLDIEKNQSHKQK